MTTSNRCTNCWTSLVDRKHTVRGRCNACAQWHKTHGFERPPRLYLRFHGTVAPRDRKEFAAKT